MSTTKLAIGRAKANNVCPYCHLVAAPAADNVVILDGQARHVGGNCDNSDAAFTALRELRVRKQMAANEAVRAKFAMKSGVASAPA